MNKKILLLNPPGEHFYLRDYFCSKISKASYYTQPVDFLLLSGLLSQNHEVTVMDCIADQMTYPKTMHEVSIIKPDIIIFLTGAVSMENDFPFLIRLKEKTQAFMIGIGDIFLDYAEELLKKWLFIDAALLDFTTDDLIKFLKDKNGTFYNIVYRDADQIRLTERKSSNKSFSVPLPKHNLFKNKKYIFPFARKKVFATVLTAFGCPFQCTYCPVNPLGYKVRPVADVMQELTFINNLNIYEIFFKDQTFTADYQRTLEICTEIINGNIKIGWTCFGHIRNIDKPLLLMMKKAGCHTILLGIETADEGLAQKYKRPIDTAETCNKLQLCKEIGITTVGTFIIGLPDDTIGSIMKTIEFSKEISLDFASFNIFTPAYGSTLRKELLAHRIIEDKVAFIDCGISKPNENYGSLSKKDIWSLRKKAIYSFYFRPGYLLNLLTHCHNLYDFLRLFKQGIGLIKSI